jgi:hypothetical protein
MKKVKNIVLTILFWGALLVIFNIFTDPSNPYLG